MSPPLGSSGCDPDEWRGDHLPCPRCGSTNTIRLVTVHHCNGCEKSFTPYEVILRARIMELEKQIVELKRRVKHQI
jgi:hypothetical protein